MANPFLVIGGVAVGVVTAGIGVMQVPGWIDSANDSAVREDLSQVAIAQEAAYTVAANYSDSITDLADGIAADNAGTPVPTGVEIQQSSGVKLSIATNSSDDEWAAVGVSKSGHVFVRTSESAEIITDDSKEYAEAIANIDVAGVTLGGSETAPTISFTGGAG